MWQRLLNIFRLDEDESTPFGEETGKNRAEKGIGFRDVWMIAAGLAVVIYMLFVRIGLL